jgi:hypothetical protein
MGDVELEKFRRLVITSLRDSGIKHFDRLAVGHWKAPSLKNRQAELAKLTDEQRMVTRRCVVNCLDNALHDFLFALVEANDFDKGITLVVDGKNLAEISDGLHGEPFTDEGWIARFSEFPETSAP